MLVPTRQPSETQPLPAPAAAEGIDPSTDDDEIVVEPAQPLDSSEQLPGASTRAQRRARNIAAAARVNLPNTMTRRPS